MLAMPLSINTLLATLNGHMESDLDKKYLFIYICFSD
jgi:hypothetical protein